MNQPSTEINPCGDCTSVCWLAELAGRVDARLGLATVEHDLRTAEIIRLEAAMAALTRHSAAPDQPFPDDLDSAGLPVSIEDCNAALRDLLKADASSRNLLGSGEEWARQAKSLAEAAIAACGGSVRGIRWLGSNRVTRLPIGPRYCGSQLVEEVAEHFRAGQAIIAEVEALEDPASDEHEEHEAQD